VGRRVTVTPAQVFGIAGVVDLIHGLRRLVWDVGPMSAIEQVEFGLIALLLAGILAGVRRYCPVIREKVAGTEAGEP
jgi:hypothetical protein